MASVNNASGVYTTLGYNFSDPNGYVTNLSDSTQTHLSNQPAFISSWQAQDIVSGLASNNTNYYQNPVSDIVNKLKTNVTLISTVITSNDVTSLSDVANIANSLIITTTSFLNHTNRISGVTVFNGDTTVPYYTTAMSYGKTAMYIVNQTDGISNNSPILGSFTSLLVTPQINVYSNIVTTSANTITYSISGSSTSLTTNQINKIYSDLSNTNTFLTNQQNSDVTFFTNLQTMVNNYNNVRQFSNLGDTANYLLTNFIGTPHLVTNLKNTS
jgi:hypothetical protein